VADAGDLTIVSELVFPAQTNHHGTLFAGEALRLLSMAALIAASRDARQHVVMAAVDHTDFLKPVQCGALAEVLARVVERGKSSLVVALELFSENMQTGERMLCVTSSITMVTVDADGRPAPRRS
jgi:acyl-CoA hydrolase